jgi:hypothetical protein
MIDNWISLGDYSGVKCINCSFLIKGAHAVDHHSRYCPNCKEESIFFDFGENRVLQLALKKSPPTFQKFIKWSQVELDEREIAELIVAFEEMSNKRSNRP